MIIEYCRRSCWCTKLDRIRHLEIRRTVEVETDVVDSIEAKRLLWYRHARRAGVDSLINRLTVCSPIGKRKSSRPRGSMKHEADKAIEKKELEKDEWHNKDK